MNTLYQEIISNIQKIKIDFTNTSWRNSIPSNSGWYFIETTTPISVLSQTNNPIRPGLNYDIPARISNSGVIQKSKLLIEQQKNNPYIVYSGENKNLKARACFLQCKNPHFCKQKSSVDGGEFLTIKSA